MTKLETIKAAESALHENETEQEKLQYLHSTIQRDLASKIQDLVGTDLDLFSGLSLSDIIDTGEYYFMDDNEPLEEGYRRVANQLKSRLFGDNPSVEVLHLGSLENGVYRMEIRYHKTIESYVDITIDIPNFSEAYLENVDNMLNGFILYDGVLCADTPELHKVYNNIDLEEFKKNLSTCIRKVR